MNIKPSESTIRIIFESGFYKIPRFQRPYSWDRGNIEEFWSDVSEGTSSYFIGSMVFYKKGKDEIYIVDGQQRLTTITIFLAALRDSLVNSEEKSLAKGIQNVIERKDLNDERRYVLLTETSYPYFQEHIQKFGEPDLDADPTPEELGLKGAHDFALEKLAEIVSGIENTSLPIQKKKERIRSTLAALRDRLLALQVIIVLLDNEDDAYVIFETLNTRGKDLAVEDLLKNHLARLLPAKSADVDATRTRWNKITRKIAESAANLEMSNYVHHFWLSRADYTSKKTLFKRIKASINKTNAKQFLEDLEEGVPFYRRIFEPENFKWKKEERQVARSLAALQTFHMRQPTPLVFSLLRAYEGKNISLKQLKDTLLSIENFHFLHTAIASLSSSGGISMMYAAAARELFTIHDAQKRASHIQKFRAKLRERVPEEDTFKAQFLELRFISSDTKQKPLVRYVLEKFDEHQRHDKNVDYDKMTVEHISPENPNQAAKAKVTDVGLIGNLIFVSEETNGKLKNKDFLSKKAILKNDHVPIDPVLDKATVWTDTEIRKRSEYFAKLAFEHIWNL
jgi:hypothetical protein